MWKNYVSSVETQFRKLQFNKPTNKFTNDYNNYKQYLRGMTMHHVSFSVWVKYSLYFKLILLCQETDCNGYNMKKQMNKLSEPEHNKDTHYQYHTVLHFICVSYSHPKHETYLINYLS